MCTVEVCASEGETKSAHLKSWKEEELEGGEFCKWKGGVGGGRGRRGRRV